MGGDAVNAILKEVFSDEQRLAHLFRGLTRAYGTYDLSDPKVSTKTGKVTGKAITVQKEVTPTLWNAHLNGTKGLGIVPINEENECWFGAIDIDKYPLDLNQIEAKVAALNLPLLPTRTKSGGAHLYAFGKEAMPPKLLSKRLGEWAEAIGHGGVEVFPKQGSLSAADTGNWINMPYFGIQSGKTERYGIFKGQPLSLTQYCDRAEQIALTVEQLEKVAVAAPFDFREGPPCLQSMHDQGFTDATCGEHPHNETMFAIGVYLKKRYPNDWRAHISDYNALLQPPLDPGELRSVVKSLAKKDYTYKCKEAPCKDFCNRTLCETRQYGVKDLPAPEPWSTPHDFLHERTAIAFTAEDVPTCIGDYAARWAAAAGFDPTGVIASCVVTTAAALHDSIRLSVQPATNWLESARLWVAIIGQPGLAKTPMIRAGDAPLIELHREKVAAFSSAADLEKQHQADKKRKGEEAERPPLPALFTNDCTIEKLSEVLADNPGGVLYITEELDSWLGSHDAYRSGGGSRDRGEWLTLYDGGPHQVDRVKRGSFFVANWGVSFISATTPAALQKLVHKLPNDGLLQRILPFMIAHPGAPDPTVPVREAADLYDKIVRRVNEYAANGLLVTLDVDARALFETENIRYRELAPACAVISEGLAGHVAKYGTVLARLVVTFHSVQCAMAEGRVHPASLPVSLITVELAARFLRKVFRHARAFYGMLSGTDGILDIARRVGTALVADGLMKVGRRDLVQKYQIFRDADDEKRRDAMQLLVDFGWCRALPGKYQMGYPTNWEINPAVHERFCADGEAWLRRRALVKEAILGQEGGVP